MKRKRIDDLRRPFPTFVEVASFRPAEFAQLCRHLGYG